MHSSLFWYQGHLKLNILFTHPFVSEMCGNSTHRKQEPKQHKTTWGKENKMFNLVICSPPSFYHNTGSPKMLFPSLHHKFLSNDMWLPPCPRTATLLKAWKLHSLLCFKLSWQNPAGFRLDTHGCWRRSQISRGHSIVHKIQLFFFFFFLVCRSYSAVVHFWRNLDLGSQDLKQLAPEERWKSFMEAAQILAKAFVAQDILSEGSTHETYQLLVAFTTMRDLNPMPLPLVDYFKFIR